MIKPNKEAMLAAIDDARARVEAGKIEGFAIVGKHYDAPAGETADLLIGLTVDDAMAAHVLAASLLGLVMALKASFKLDAIEIGEDAIMIKRMVDEAHNKEGGDGAEG